MAIYRKSNLKNLWENLNLNVSKLFARKELLEGIESQIADRIYADNAAAIAGGLKPGQLYFNSSSSIVTVVV